MRMLIGIVLVLSLVSVSDAEATCLDKCTISLSQTGCALGKQKEWQVDRPLRVLVFCRQVCCAPIRDPDGGVRGDCSDGMSFTIEPKDLELREMGAESAVKGTFAKSQEQCKAHQAFFFSAKLKSGKTYSLQTKEPGGSLDFAVVGKLAQSSEKEPSGNSKQKPPADSIPETPGRGLGCSSLPDTSGDESHLLLFGFLWLGVLGLRKLRVLKVF